MIRYLVAPAVACAVVLGACASAPAASSAAYPTTSSFLLDLSPWQTPVDQPCEIAAADSLPAFAAVFDSLALLASAHRLTASGALLVSVGTDSLGRPARFHRIETTLPPAETVMLEDSLRTHFRGGTPFGARVRVDITPGQEPRFRMGVRQQCGPVLRNRTEIQRYLGDANQRAKRSGTVMLWVFVEEDGAVKQARVVEPSGYDFLDAVSVGIATQMRFQPATIDRRPVPVWIQIPFALRVR